MKRRLRKAAVRFNSLVVPRMVCSRPHREVDSASDHEAGLATAEYAVATIAAVGFAALLIVILKSDPIKQLLQDIFENALRVV